MIFLTINCPNLVYLLVDPGSRTDGQKRRVSSSVRLSVRLLDGDWHLRPKWAS